MNEEEPPEGLDDLRKRRLAYFETLNQASHNKPQQSNTVSRQDKTVSRDIHENLKEKAADIHSYEDRMHELTFQFERTKSKDNITSSSTPIEVERTDTITDYVTRKMKSNGFNGIGEKESAKMVQIQEKEIDSASEKEISQYPLKTSFYFCNLEDERSQTKHEVDKPVPIANSEHVLLKRDTSDSLDAYNETVERLIKATKEEILGNEVSDDIWTNFHKESNVVDVQKRNEQTSEKAKKNSLELQYAAQSGWNKMQPKPFPNLLNRSLSETGMYENAHLDMNSNTVKGYEFEKSNNRYREPRSSLSTVYDSRHMYSSGAPVQASHHQSKDTQKNLNSTKVEEIFSSRQVRHSEIHRNAFMQESQEFDPIREVVGFSLEQSQDLSELGLATHRPESDKTDEIKVEAGDINLGETVSKELRTVLGEEKFHQFLMNAKRDIDDLHQDKSNENSVRKVRTPRLLKEMSAKSSKPTSKPKEVKEDQPKSILKNRDTREEVTSDQTRMQGSVSESHEIQDSQDFTPRQTDGDAVESLIGEFMLKKYPDKNNRLTANPAYKTTLLKSEKNGGAEENNKTSVPTLDLEEVSKPESPRPKLNRPKHEPPTIYQDIPETDIVHKEKSSNRDMRSLPGKNYEQVTVPRNVAFSANEIYNQAYGALYPGQAPMTSSHYHTGPVVTQGLYGSPPPSTAFNAPVTPTTPVRPCPASQAYMHSEQFPNQSGFVNYAEDFSSYKNFSRQPSYSGDRAQIPHPPGHQGPTAAVPVPYSPGYASVPSDLGSFVPPSVHRFAAPMMVPEQSLHMPHPPSSAPMPISQIMNQSNVSVPYCLSQGIPTSYPYQYPVVLNQTALNDVGHEIYQSYPETEPGVQVYKPHPPTSIGAQVYRPASETVSTKDTRPNQYQQLPSTPTTSNAEVQTDRQDTPVNDEKVTTVVDESTFTSVSQIIVDDDDEKFLPHPPAAKKEGGPSPRRHHNMDVASGKAQDSKRHIDGIRQHHEQRRQQHEGEVLSENQIVERQKNFAKASLERYFSSLENVYKSSSKMRTEDVIAETNLPDNEDNQKIPKQSGNDVISLDDDIVDDVISNILIETEDKSGEVDLLKQNSKSQVEFLPVVHGFIDFNDNIANTENYFDRGTSEEHGHEHLFENENGVEFDGATLVNSTANTDVTINGGGLTDRLNDLGIDISHVKETESESISKTANEKKGEKKGKILIICPDCGGLNKEYMSWCTQCGEMIIGVEPMLVSKTRDGKIRTKPLNNVKLEKTDEIRIKDTKVEIQKTETKLATMPHKVSCVQALDEKHFTLNLEGIKSDKHDKEDHLTLFENKKASPIKSDGKDSGRPSSDDPDFDLQTQKIEEEVVNDICASISDPVLKGYVKSHFNKSKHSWQDSEGRQSKADLNNGLGNSEDNTEVKNFVSTPHNDIVSVGLVSKRIYSMGDSRRVETRSFDKTELKDRHKSDEDYYPAQYDSYAHDNVQAKIAMFNQKQLEENRQRCAKTTEMGKQIYGKDNNYEKSEVELFEPPPDPSFSLAMPVSRSELSLKLPANSLEWSTDVSQVVSHDFDNANDVNKQSDNVVDDDETLEEKALKRAARRQERRRKRGHGAIDVEVFGYDESRESRNCSRANRLVPLLNLAGNSSDEDDSVYSDFIPIKPDLKPEVKLIIGTQIQTKVSVNAWEPAVIHEEPFDGEESLSLQELIREEQQIIDESSLLWKQPDVPLSCELKQSGIAVQKSDENTRASAAQNPTNSREPSSVLQNPTISREQPQEDVRSPESPDIIGKLHGQEIQGTNYVHLETEGSEKLNHLFDPCTESQPNEEEPVGVQEETPDGNQPFLMQFLSEPKLQKSKQKPRSARGKPVKSKVRQSIEDGGYQQKWKRSSTAWGSYNQGELSTTTNLRSSTDLSKSRPSSGPKSRGSLDIPVDQASSNQNVSRCSPVKGVPGKNKRPFSAPKSSGSKDVQASVSPDEQVFDEQDVRRSSPVRGLPGQNKRPFSAPKSRTIDSSMQASVDYDDDDDEASSDVDVHVSQPGELDIPTSQPVRTTPGKKGRPFTTNPQKRKLPKKKNKKSCDSFDLEFDLVTEMVEHRLPKPSTIDRLSAKPTVPVEPELMASPRSTYDKYLEMTPRIQAGSVSRWQCLPDEILIHIFSNLDQSSLTICAQVCQQYYRVAMDESLWKYITIKKSNIDDDSLAEISRRHPVSLALIQCHGEQVTAKGLRDLFRECAGSLKELNVARCSRGALNGDSLMLHAAARCHSLTHVDASWCGLTDSGLMAISNSCHRLESLCINGCNAVTNDGLETIIKKHGTFLRVLEMFGCFNLSPRGLRSVSNNCINLITLNLGQCYKLTDSCVSQLSTSLGRVESLDLRGCKQIKDNCMRRVVKNCNRLKHLSLANCPNITDVSILEISTYLTDIRSIDLCGCENITDSSIRALVNTCTNLRNIDISSTGCTHRSVSMIANFSGQRLETLKLNFLADVTEQSLIKLAKHCRRLTSVHMYGCTSVRNLDKVKEERPTFNVEM